MYFFKICNILASAGPSLNPVTLPRWTGNPPALCARLVQPGLALTFPSIYQYRQSSFALLDPTKPERQTLVSFLLVVPEAQGVTGRPRWRQQREWVQRAVDESVEFRMPGEVVEQIVDSVNRGMDACEAERYATELREAR